MTPETLIPPEQLVGQQAGKTAGRSLIRGVCIFIFEMFTVYKHDGKRTTIKA